MNIKELYQSKQELKQQEKRAWLITFNDLLSLLVTFFVLLYSFSVINPDRWWEVGTSVSDRFENVKEFRIPYLKVVDNLYLQNLIIERLKKTKELSYIDVFMENEKLYIVVPLSKVFSKEAEMNPNGVALAYFLSNIFSPIENVIDFNFATDLSKVDTADILLIEKKLDKSLKFLDLLREITTNDNYQIFLSNKINKTIDKNKTRYSSTQRLEIIIHE